MLKVRLKRLRNMSVDFLSWDGKDATQLYGIGKYGSDSYRLFYKNEIPTNVGDPVNLKDILKRSYVNE